MIANRDDYRFNYTHIEPLALSDDIPPGQYFQRKWISMLLKVAVKVAINSWKVNRREKSDADIENEVVSLFRQVFQQTLTEQPGTNRLNWRDRLESVVGSLVAEVPTAEKEVDSFLEAIAPHAGQDFSKSLAESLLSKLDAATPAPERKIQATSLADYEEQFQSIPLPKIARDFQTDDSFAYMRVAGPNPMLLERMTALSDRFPVTDEDYRTAIGDESDSLAAAISEGRAYWVDYAMLDGAIDGTYGPHPMQQKYLYAPLALFAVPRGDAPDRTLKPIAIKCGQADSFPVLTPQSGEYAWLAAKTVVQVADANYHEAIAHLARTHLTVEPIAIATYRCLESTHPLYPLLASHFDGTFAINNAAHRFLVAPKGGVNGVLAATIDCSRTFAVVGVQMSFNEWMFPSQIASRGVDDETLLPVYPYRDDGRLIWNAIHTWVEQYVCEFYTSDADVLADEQLQSWSAEIVAFDGGRVADFGDRGDGKIATVSYLVEALTATIFTASAQHAAVNFPQKGIMSYSPAMPLAGYLSAEKVVPGMTEADYLQLLPPLEQAMSGVNLLVLLGSIYYNQLGDYQKIDFSDRVKPFLEEFRQSLNQIELEIDRRNQSRPEYVYLKPSQIPQSINI
ncbi:MAG: lipoxygenase family protein [Cyanobacteria bacterium J06639_1]